MTKPVFLHENRFDDAVPLASTTATGFDVLNLREWRDYNFWRPTAMPANVTVDAGAAKAADYAVVWGHNLGTQGGTFEVRGSTDNFVASNDLVATSTPATDDPFALFFTSVSYRYWRMAFTGASVPTLAIASVGSRLELPDYLETGFDPLGRQAKGRFNRSVKGRPLGRNVDYELWSQDLEFTQIDRAWLRSTFEPAWKDHLRGEPFVFLWDRGGHPTELKLVVSDAEFKTPHLAGTKADLRIELEAAQ